VCVCVCGVCVCVVCMGVCVIRRFGQYSVRFSSDNF